MTSTVTLKGVSLSPQENTFVQAAKHRLIDTLMFAGIRYAPIGFISGLLNQTIHKLGPGEEKTIPVDDNFDIIKSDAVDMRLHVAHFIERLEQEKIHPAAVATFKEIIEQGIAVREDNHHRLNAAYLVYGFIANPTLNIIDFDGKLIYFDHQTEVFGVLIESKAPNEFIEVGQLDENEWQEKYDAYVLAVIASVAEVEGDLVTPTQRIRWEKKFRAQKPKLMVGLSE